MHTPLRVSSRYQVSIRQNDCGCAWVVAGEAPADSVQIVTCDEHFTTACEALHSLPGGGTRSEKAPAYHLVPGEGLRRTALRFALGAEKHGPEQWKKSVQNEHDAKLWAQECFNHMQEHALKMVSGDFPDDDHLGAIGWAQSVLCYIEATYSKLWTDLSDKEIEALPLERITVPENYLRSK